MIVGSGSMPLNYGSGSGFRRPKNIGTDPTDSDQDPQHCWELWSFTMKPFKDYPGEVNGLKVSNANTVQIAILLSYRPQYCTTYKYAQLYKYPPNQGCRSTSCSSSKRWNLRPMIYRPSRAQFWASKASIVSVHSTPRLCFGASKASEFWPSCGSRSSFSH